MAYRTRRRYWRDVLDIAARAGHLDGDVEVAAGRRSDRPVHRGIAEAGLNGRGNNAAQLVGPFHARTEGQRLEDVARVVVERGHRRARQPVVDADAADPAPGKQMLQRLAGTHGKAGGGGVVIGQQRLLRIGDVGAGAVGDGIRLGRVVIRLLREHLETYRNRLVAQIWLVESEAQIALQVADVGGGRQRLAQPEKVVGGVFQPDEGARQAADAAVDANRVLPLLLDLQQQLDGAVVRVLVGLGVVVHLQRVEEPQLVQPQHGQVPQLLAVDLAFFQDNFAADYLVPGARIAGELDARHQELLVLVDVNGPVHQLLGVVELSSWIGHQD